MGNFRWSAPLGVASGIVAITQQDLSSAPTPKVDGTTKRRSVWPLEFYRSAVGKKYVMAITGIALLGYVLAHMIGNLKSYLGPVEMDVYEDVTDGA